MKSSKSNRICMDQNISYGPSKEELLKQFARDSVQAQINLSVLPKEEPGKTAIIMCRNSRKAVKRAKEDYKTELQLKTHSVERNAMIHQIVQCKNPKMNVKVFIN